MQPSDLRTIIREELRAVLVEFFPDKAKVKRDGRKHHNDMFDPTVPYRDNYNAASRAFVKAGRDRLSQEKITELREVMRHHYNLFQRMKNRGHDV